MERIEVRYSQLGPNYYHEYLVYTDSEGNEWAARGGPSNRVGLGESTEAQSGSATSGDSPFGDITTKHGAYDPDFIDYDYEGDDPSEVIVTGDDLSGDWQRVTDAIDDIGEEGRPYRPLSQNSNTTVAEALDRADLPQPQQDGIGDNWSPGSEPGMDWDWVDDLASDLADDFIEFGYDFGDFINDIEDSVNDFFNDARNWIRRRDPLTLDLDGDGLETVGIDAENPVIFDHDGDGTANATGWIKPDDGFLVFDRNENGTIDNGTELFGDSTPLLDENGEVVGQAADGFDALAVQDSNGDGLVDSNDANWEKLRVWQDADSDGQTDEGELKTLEELGIEGFHVEKTENTTILSNGNAVADLGSFIRSDGTEGTMGQVTGNMADIDLADNPFYREFDDAIPLTEEAEQLPDMKGSGSSRDLQEAASLSSSLASSLGTYAEATTKAEQMALVDGVIAEWAGSSSAKTSIEQARDQGYELEYLVPGLTPSMLWQAGLGHSYTPDDGSGSIDAESFQESQQRLEDAAPGAGAGYGTYRTSRAVQRNDLRRYRTGRGKDGRRPDLVHSRR